MEARTGICLVTLGDKVLILGTRVLTLGSAGRCAGGGGEMKGSVEMDGCALSATDDAPGFIRSMMVGKGFSWLNMVAMSRRAL